jgi:hypothetical protein
MLFGIDNSVLINITFISVIVFSILGGFFNIVSIYELNNEVLELENDVIECEKKIGLKEDRINSLEYDLVVSEENEGFVRSELVKSRSDLGDLKKVYNSLWVDATSCFWANYCAYYPSACEEHFDYESSAIDLHVLYSDECDILVRDWDVYSDNFSGEFE